MIKTLFRCPYTVGYAMQERKLIILKEKDTDGKNKSILVPIKSIDEFGVTYTDERSPTYDEVLLPWHSIEKVKSIKKEVKY